MSVPALSEAALLLLKEFVAADQQFQGELAAFRSEVELLTSSVAELQRSAEDGADTLVKCVLWSN